MSAIGGINHHSQIDTSFEDIAGNGFPRVGTIGVRHVETLHQRLRQLYIQSFGQAFLIDILHGGIVKVKTYHKGIELRVA